MSDHKTVSWQVIAVAFKLKVVAPFIQGAQDLNGEIPGAKIEPGWGQKSAQKVRKKAPRKCEKARPRS